MSRGWRVPVLAVVWGGAVAAILLKAVLASGTKAASRRDRPRPRLGRRCRLRPAPQAARVRAAAPRRRRTALLAWRDHLRPQAPRPDPPHPRLPRNLPPAHAGRSRMPVIVLFVLPRAYVTESSERAMATAVVTADRTSFRNWARDESLEIIIVNT